MILEKYRDPVTLAIIFKLQISDNEIMDAAFRLTDDERRHMLPYFGRPDSTIEEKLMGLQIIARRIEEAHANG